MPESMKNELSWKEDLFLAVYDWLADTTVEMIEARNQNWSVGRFSRKDIIGFGLLATGKQDSGRARRKRESPLRVLTLPNPHFKETKPR